MGMFTSDTVDKLLAVCDILDKIPVDKLNKTKEIKINWDTKSVGSYGYIVVPEISISFHS